MKASGIVIVSDVSVGYGSPQVLSLARSLREYYGGDVVVFEPDQPERPAKPERHADLTVERIYTSTHPHSISGQIEYNQQITARINDLRPAILVVCAFLGAAALLKVKVKPPVVIYYGYEHTDGGFLREQRIFKAVADRIDLVIFCEENRAFMDAPRLGLERKPTAILYNGANYARTPIAPGKRNGRLVYAGQIDPVRTLGSYYFEGGLDEFDIDIFGVFQQAPDADAWLRGLAERGARISYNGYLPYGEDFLDNLAEYCFSIVAWAPLSESTRFAAPNKFFDAIAAGVPPLAAPHPICRRIVDRYGCGLLLDGWSLDDFKRGCRKALEMTGSEAYSEMIERSLPWAAEELSWPRQFQKLLPLLERASRFDA